MLYSGVEVNVDFTNVNTATTPTLNINSTGAKSIRFNGVVLNSASYARILQGVMRFSYDGTYWNIISPSRVTVRCQVVSSSGTYNVVFQTNCLSSSVATMLYNSGYQSATYCTYTSADQSIYASSTSALYINSTSVVVQSQAVYVIGA
jgi:hypothetical protein